MIVELMLSQTATQIVASMLALEAMGETEDIQLYINSQGLRMPFMCFVGKQHMSH